MACAFAACTAPAVFIVSALLGGLLYRFSPSKRRLICCCNGLVVSTIFGVAIVHLAFHSFFVYSSVTTKTVVPPVAGGKAGEQPVAAEQLLSHPVVDFLADYWRNQYGSVDTRVTDPKFAEPLQHLGMASGVAVPVLLMLSYICHFFGARIAVLLQLVASVLLAGICYMWIGTEYLAGMPHIAKENHLRFGLMSILPLLLTVLLALTSLLSLCFPPKSKDESPKKSSKKTQ